MKTFQYKSQKRVGITHTVTVEEGSAPSCTCESFLYSPSVPQTCKHTKDVERGGTGNVVGGPLTLDGLSPIPPMLASKPLGGKGINDYPVADWVLEEKFDGHRMIITTRSGQAPLAWSRVGNAKPLPEHLAREVMSNLPTGTFDGEIYVPGGTSTDVTALENTQLLQLVLFDVLLVENANVMQMDATARRQILQTAGAKLQGDFLSIAPQYVPSEGMLLKLWNRGGEGGILKRRDAVYEFGKRAKTWVKLKKQGSAVITVDRFERGLLGPHSVIIGHTDGGVSVSVKSLNDSWRAIFATRSTEFVGRRLVVAYQEQTRDGKLRHPMAEHFEEGGPAGPKLEIGTMR